MEGEEKPLVKRLIKHEVLNPLYEDFDEEEEEEEDVKHFIDHGDQEEEEEDIKLFLDIGSENEQDEEDMKPLIRYRYPYRRGYRNWLPNPVNIILDTGTYLLPKYP